MRLKSLTNLMTCLLLGVCLMLGGTLWWSQRALEAPYQLMERYLDLSQQFQTQVSANVLGYLDNGDTLLHSRALQSLADLQATVGGLPPALVETVRPSLEALQRFTETELLAAGKLAGDPQGLLLQSEREISGALDQLARYAEESDQPAAARYYPVLFLASQNLLRLSQVRERFVGQNNQELAGDVARELEALRRQSDRLEALPLLGVEDATTSGADTFAALMGLAAEEPKATAEDRGIALKRELDTLLQRYPGELDNTRALIDQRVSLASATRQRTENVRQALAELDHVVREEHGRIQGEVRLMLGLMIGLILLVAFGIDRIQRTLTRLLGQLGPTLSHWAAGDFSTPVALRTRIRDMHDLQESLNRLRDYLGSLVGQIRQNAERMTDSSRTLADLSGGLHQGAERQAGDTALIRDALSEMEATIQQVAEDANQTAMTSRDAGQSVAQSQRVIDQSLAGMQALVGEVQRNAESIERLAAETNTIGEVLVVIRGIADQTNLLALNAAIEAARAGEQGRGFAVVADEVRSLAQRSAGATEEIQQVIDRLQAAASGSMDAMRLQVEHVQANARQAEVADGALIDVVESIRTIASMAERIAHATAQQSLAVSEIRDHSERIHSLGEGNLQLIDGGRQQGEELLQLGGELQVAVQAFRVA